ASGTHIHNGSSRSQSILFKHTATSEIYTLSLHDALPIYFSERSATHASGKRITAHAVRSTPCVTTVPHLKRRRRGDARHSATARSEEHTSELQSQSNLVCRLLLEKKKTVRMKSVNACMSA